MFCCIEMWFSRYRPATTRPSHGFWHTLILVPSCRPCRLKCSGVPGTQKQALVMLNFLPSRGCVRMCALARGHTHGSVAFSVYPCLPLGPPRGAPCLVGVIAATRRPCTRMATRKKHQTVTTTKWLRLWLHAYRAYAWTTRRPHKKQGSQEKERCNPRRRASLMKSF